MSHVNRTDDVEIPVSDQADVVLAGRKAEAVLANLAFDEPAIEEIVLVIHELASNIAKHAGEGTITLTPEANLERTGIEINARDSGPGIADVDQAVADGYSTAGGIGGGLGTIHRLMDEVIIQSTEDVENGIHIVANRWTRADTSDRAKPRPIPQVGAVTRPKPGCEHNGDAFLIEHESNRTLVGVIDGLGHGRAAHRASSAAREYVQQHSTDSLDNLFDGVEQACRPTRGVVMALARFDWDDGQVTAGSVGNISVRVCNSSTPHHLVPKRGVIGGNAPSPVLADWEWDRASVMLLHSDGLEPRWKCDEFALHDDRTATVLAQEILGTYSKQDDDATVLVVGGSTDD